MYKKILHATDLSENHYTLCQQAMNIAKCFQAKLSLIHVIEIPSSIQLAQSLGFMELVKPLKDQGVATLNIVGESLGILPQSQYVEIGSIKTHIINKINELGFDLIIIGSHTPSHLPNFLSSTAHMLTNHVPCDVLTIRS